MKHIKCLLKVPFTVVIGFILFLFTMVQVFWMLGHDILYTSGCVKNPVDVLKHEPLVFNTKFWKWYRSL